MECKPLVAMIVNTFPALSEKFLLNQIVALKKQGYDITILSSMRSNDPLHTIYTENKLEQNTISLNIPHSHFKRCFNTIPIILKLLVTHPGLLIRALNKRRYKTMALNLKNIYFLNYFLHMKIKPDVLHCHFGQNGFIGSFLKDIGFVDKLIVTFHGADVLVYPQKIGNRCYESVFQTADFITCGSFFIKEKLLSMGCPENKLQIIPVGISEADFMEPLDISNFEVIKHNILSIGRIFSGKGFIYAVSAIAQVCKVFPDTKYIIIGSGDSQYKLQIEEKIQDYHLEQNVILVGAKTDEEIRLAFKNNSLLLFPSITIENGWVEGQGLVIQEAAAAGLPAVASMSGGIPEGIEDGVTGYLVPEKDSQAIAEKIIQLYSNPDLHKKMILAAYIHARKYYNSNALAEKTASLYQG